MQRHDEARWLLALSGTVMVCLTLAACRMPHSTMTVDGKIRTTAKMVNGTCDFTDAAYHVGDEVVLRGADNTILAIDHLHLPDVKPPPGGACDLAFHFDKVRPDDAAYQLKVGSSRRIAVTEDQLGSKDFEVIPRGPSGNGDPDFKVIPTPSSSPQPRH